MRSYDEYKAILELWEAGINKKAISRITGIPRATVHDCINHYLTVDGLEAEFQKRASRRTQPALVQMLSSEETAEEEPLFKAYAYVLGLEDGNISTVRNVYRLRVTLDARYPQIIQTCVKAVKMLLPNNQVSVMPNYDGDRINYVNVTCHYKYWDELIPQRGVGLKHERSIVLQDWQKRIVHLHRLEFFRGLYHSDGCRFSNVVNGTNYPRYQFTNHSTDIMRLFCETCEALGLRWTPKRRYAKISDQVTDVFISRRKDVQYLDRVVGPKQ
jgi:hypothetical protein